MLACAAASACMFKSPPSDGTCASAGAAGATNARDDRNGGMGVLTGRGFGTGRAIRRTGESRRHLRLRARVFQARFAVLPRLQIDGMTERGELSQNEREVRRAGFPSARGVHGGGGELLPLQGQADEAAQAGARADLHERAHAVAVHRFDELHEFDGLAELVREQVPRLRGFGRIRLAGGVRVDGHGGLRERNVLQGLRERGESLGDQRAVERGGDGQAHAPQTAGGQDLFRLLDLRGRAGQDVSARGVAGLATITRSSFSSDTAFSTSERDRQNGQHRAKVALAGSHQAAAEARQRM